MHVLKKTAHLARGFFPNRVGSGEENFIVLFLRGASVSGIHLWNGMSDLAISCYTLHKGIGLSSVIDSASLHFEEFASKLSPNKSSLIKHVKQVNSFDA